MRLLRLHTHISKRQDVHEETRRRRSLFVREDQVTVQLTPDAAFHDFPTGACTIAHDSELSLLALATKKGDLRIYGQPGVEYHGSLTTDGVVREMIFVKGRAQLLTLMDDGLLQLWQDVLPAPTTEEITIDPHKIELVASVNHFLRHSSSGDAATAPAPVDADAAAVVSDHHGIKLLLTSDLERVLVGTTGDNVYTASMASFTVSHDTAGVLYLDVALHSVPSDVKKTSNQGGVEVLSERPRHPGCFMIDYNRGLLVLWNSANKTAERVFNSTQQLEPGCWLSSGDAFVSCNDDGHEVLDRENT